MGWIFISLLLGAFIGATTNHYLSKYLFNRENSKIISENEDIFKEIFNSIKIGKSKFKSRFLQTAYITTNLSTLGEVDIVYLINDSDVAIIKDNKIIYTSDKVSSNIIDDIVRSINIKHGFEINDVVNIFGLTISKSVFEKTINMRFEDYVKLFDDPAPHTPTNIPLNEPATPKKLSVNDILDKINKYGINSLTKAEIDYLDNLDK